MVHPGTDRAYQGAAGAGAMPGQVPGHARVLFIKDVAITLVILLALPWLVHRLLTRPHTVLGGGPNVSLS